ncbi:unnamed protein product [Allacma fusca]|uniref:Uncharacterized protein n=1 Tax=Allacma fusca TaxID=39272 RepID=A0A8J2JXI1_9HEXA|nr:unnamed protein product [Allacma fusca]
MASYYQHRYDEPGHRCVSNSQRSTRQRSFVALNVFLVNFFVFICVLNCQQSGVNALAVDSGKTSVVASPAASGNLPGTLFGTDAAGNPISLGNWLDYASYLLAVTMSGQGFLILMAMIPVYYTLFAVTDPDELQRRSSSGRSEKNATQVVPSSWNIQRIVKMITLAIETYQQLDMREADCQKKLLCELQQGKDVASTTARTLSNLFLYFDFFKRSPQLEEYREAIVNGQRRISSRSTADACSSFYSKCKFSITEFNEKYRRLLSS